MSCMYVPSVRVYANILPKYTGCYQHARVHIAAYGYDRIQMDVERRCHTAQSLSLESRSSVLRIHISYIAKYYLYPYIYTHIYICISTYLDCPYVSDGIPWAQSDLPLKVSCFPCVLRIVHGTVLQRCRQCRRVQRHSTLERLVVESFSFNLGAIWDEGSVRCNLLHIVYIMYIRYVYFLIQYIIYNDILYIHAYVCVCEVGVLPSFLSVLTCGRRLFCIPLLARCEARIFKEYDTNGNGTLEASEQLSSTDSIVDPFLAALPYCTPCLEIISSWNRWRFVFWFLSFPLGSFRARMLVNYAWTLAACCRLIAQGWHLSWKPLSKAMVLWPLEFKMLEKL